MSELIDEAAPLLQRRSPRRSAQQDVRFDAEVDAWQPSCTYWSGDATRAVEAAITRPERPPPRPGGMAAGLATRYKAAGWPSPAEARGPCAARPCPRGRERHRAPGIALQLLSKAVIHWYAAELSAVSSRAENAGAPRCDADRCSTTWDTRITCSGWSPTRRTGSTLRPPSFARSLEIRYQVNTRTVSGCPDRALSHRAELRATPIASYATRRRCVPQRCRLAIRCRWHRRLVRCAPDRGRRRWPGGGLRTAGGRRLHVVWLEVPA